MLVIFGDTEPALTGVALPETARNVVGNGSIEATGWRRTWWFIISIWVLRRKKEKERTIDEELMEKGGEMTKETSARKGKEQKARKNGRFKMANSLAAIRIIFYKDTALVLCMAASPYAVWYYVQTSIPSTYETIYNFNKSKLGSPTSQAEPAPFLAAT